ncbi:MAG: hypothetical protein EBZ69_02990, partial [Alphaproteobacteria bacterium]|nr:hypothetical protein [Alphaproteobacteria bacterium]
RSPIPEHGGAVIWPGYSEIVTYEIQPSLDTLERLGFKITAKGLGSIENYKETLEAEAAYGI